MNAGCTCCQHHFIKIITLLITWPFALRCLLNILPWTKVSSATVCGCADFLFMTVFLLLLLLFTLLNWLSLRLTAFCPRCHLKWPLFSSLPLHHTFSMFGSHILCICSLFLPLFLSLFFISYPVCLWGTSEGKLVVLSLAIGVAEQDDFANIPDLQETAQAAPPPNQELPPEKRYQKTHENGWCVCEKECTGCEDK